MSVIVPDADPFIFVAVTSILALVFSFSVEDATAWVDNVVLAILDIEAVVCVDLNERFRAIVQTHPTKNPDTEKVKLVVETVSCSVFFQMGRPEWY